MKNWNFTHHSFENKTLRVLRSRRAQPTTVACPGTLPVLRRNGENHDGNDGHGFGCDADVVLYDVQPDLARDARR